jgi:MFS family permease
MSEVQDRRSGPVILVLALCGTVVALVQTLVVPLLPDLPVLLGTGADNASWLVTVTLLTSAVTTPIVSRLADMFGKRRMMVLSLIVLVVGSVLGAFTSSLSGAIVARALQGFAPALIPVGISIMRDELPPERVGSGVALMSATLGIGAAVGLPLSGVIYSTMDWHAIFWVSGGMGAVMLGAVLFVVPESTVRSGGRFDYMGAALLSASLTMLLLAISKGGQWGWASQATIGCFVAAVVTWTVWVPWELRTSQPLVDIRTSARRPVLLTNLASVLAGFAMFANMLATTQQLQLPRETGAGFGLSATQAGLGMLPGGLAMLLLAPVSAGISRRYGPRTTLIVGTSIMALGYLGRVFLYHAVWQVVVGAIVISVGTAVTFGAMPVLIMRWVPINETAAANGLNTLLRSIGTSASSAALAALMATATVQVGGLVGPSSEAFQAGFWLAAVASLVAAGLGALIPGTAREPGQHSVARIEGTVVHSQMTDTPAPTRAFLPLARLPRNSGSSPPM